MSSPWTAEFKDSFDLKSERASRPLPHGPFSGELLPLGIPPVLAMMM
jgi:hypothetical protein